MKLGTASQIVIGTKDFDKSLPFYSNIDLKLLEKGKSPWGTQFALFTDERQNILLDETKEKENYSGLIYFNETLEDLIPHLEKLNLNVIKNENGGNLISAMFVSPDGLGVNIINSSHSGSPNPMTETTFKYGKFGEFAIDVSNMNESIKFWKQLGFEETYKNEEWEFAILVDGMTVLGLHEHEMNAKTAITYFHENMAELIPDLKKNGVEIYKEITQKGRDNPSDFNIKSPDGQMFYFFTGKI